MIEVTSAFEQESRDRDESRNRVILRFGAKQWHLDRGEAQEIIERLQEALATTEAVTLTGTVRCSGREGSLLPAEGEAIPLAYTDSTWLLFQRDGQHVTLTGRYGNNGVFRAFSWTETTPAG